MLKAATTGAMLGSARGLAWGTVLVVAITVFLMWVFFGQ